MARKITAAKIDELSLVFKDLDGVEWQPRNQEARVLFTKAAATNLLDRLETLQKGDDVSENDHKAGKRHSAADQGSIDEIGARVGKLSKMCDQFGDHVAALTTAHAQLASAKEPVVDKDEDENPMDENDKTKKAAFEAAFRAYTEVLEKAKVKRTKITDTNSSDGPENDQNKNDEKPDAGAADDEDITDGSSVDGKDAKKKVDTESEASDGDKEDVNDPADDVEPTIPKKKKVIAQKAISAEERKKYATYSDDKGDHFPMRPGSESDAEAALHLIGKAPAEQKAKIRSRACEILGKSHPACVGGEEDKAAPIDTTTKAGDHEMTEDKIAAMIAKAAKDAADTATAAVTKAMGAQIASMQEGIANAAATNDAALAAANAKAATAEAESIVAKAHADEAMEAARAFAIKAQKPQAQSAKLTAANDAHRLTTKGSVFMNAIRDNPGTHQH
jgi:hypothetical protein